MKVLSLHDLLGIHAFLVKEFGGKEELRDKAALEEALSKAMGNENVNFFKTAAALMVEMVHHAPFAQGNLRTAFFAADVFLRLNGLYLRCDGVLTQRFFSSLLEEGQFTIDNLLPWVKSNAEKLNP